MKKTIIMLGLVLVTFTDVAVASSLSTSSTPKEIVNFNNTPLCNAIVKGDLATVKKFVEYGSDVNEMSNGLSPLMLAARYNKVDILKYLLEKGADKQIKDERGNTALKYAEYSKSQEAVDYLKQA
ncbi:ankyrin repeat domain-containing protein [Flavobacterium paronense]|uniref:Ankyrin repeat domain-containing protein n=1 Tax=Flavobacterium paronense TaxID=1392775 RepID=A0ABV5GC31_9FLAO|nr:ankyrin repeat domain-containing protein [Flavobacterium paronense]MDN3677781.1 ankyrin repeat domain-containing protein [Flavobacterium paronense]